MKKICGFIKERVSICNAIAALLLAAFVVMELLRAGVGLFHTSLPIRVINSWDNIQTHNITIQDNDFYLKKGTGYISIPISEEYDEVTFYITSNSSEVILANLYYGGTSIIEKKITDSTEKLVYKTGLNSEEIKLQFKSSDNNAVVNISSITFNKSCIALNRTLIAKALFVLFFIWLILILLIIIIKKQFSIEKKNVLFSLVIISADVISVILLFLTRSFDWAGYFLYDTSDTFMDYFNMLALMSYDNPYVLDSNYPPMCFVILDFMHSFLNSSIQSISVGKDLRTIAIAMVGFIMLFAVCVSFIYYFVKKMVRNEQKTLPLLVLFTGPMLFLLERGNLLLISLTFLIIYFYGYNSNKKYIRYFSYAALAFSASIKLYPSLFGLLTLKRKNHRETLHLGVLGVLCFVIPFFRFNGLDTFRQFVHGLSAASAVGFNSGVGYNFSLNNFLRIISLMTNVEIVAPTIVRIIVLVVLLLLAYLSRMDWERLFLIATACIWVPDFSYTYTLTLYILAVVAFYNEEENRKSRFDAILLAITQSVLILPQMSWVDSYIETEFVSLKMGWSTLLINVSILLLTFRIITRVILDLVVTERAICLKQKIISYVPLVTVTFIAFFVVVGTIIRTTNYSYDLEGQGTKKNPYKIQSIDDWKYMQEKCNKGDSFEGIYFEQTTDLVFDGLTTVNPVGWSEEKASFAGIYDGNGYSIQKYYCVSNHDENMGLFGTLSGEVRNVSIEGCNIAGEYAGGVAYEVTNTGKITNCSVNGLLWGYQTGGIAVYNSGIIENCVAFVTMDSTKQYGISSDGSGSKVLNSYSNIQKNIALASRIDGNTLSYLNEYVNVNNKMLFKLFTMNNWIIEDGILKVETY